MTHDPGPAFRALHRPGDPFILANAWDVGSARMLAALGAEAIGTTSSGHAFTLGRSDGQVSRDEALAHAADLVAAMPLPVSGDLEAGYGDAPDDVAETVRGAAEAGLAGLSIEDVAHGGVAFPRDLAIERVKAGVAAARALSRDIVFLARADGVMHGAYDLEEGLARIAAFRDAGADGLYIPLPGGPDALARVVETAGSVPVNVLAVGPLASLSRADFAAAGVARISLGSALARMTHRVIHDAGAAILQDGRFDSHRMIGGGKVDALLAKGAREG
ncbi:MAG: isocitrate lyase/phosphoenolpyruvate mutase family protein [Pseudomonadota bacterium]